MAHLAHEYRHSWTDIAEVEIERHVITLGIQYVDILLDFLTWDEKGFEFPFNTHEESAILVVDILVKVDDVALVVGNKLRYLRDDALLVRAMQKQYSGWFHYVSKNILQR